LVADGFLVQLDLGRIRENLARAGDTLTTLQVEDWLRENGFVRTAGGWLVEELSLQLLGDGEILGMEPYA
jgi:hypothetical protein